MSNKRLTPQNRQFLEFIDELKEQARSRAKTSEVSRVLKEIADILGEAFDEYEPSELPKHQRKLEDLIRLVEQEASLQTPELRSIVKRSKELLDKKVQERFGALRKIEHLASQTARSLSDVSAPIRDFVAIGDQAAETGRRFSNFKMGGSRLGDDETHRQYDSVKGNNEYQSAIVRPYSPTPFSEQRGLPEPHERLGLPAPMTIIPVKDDKLIGANNNQNKVLIQLISVNKDMDSELKQIRSLLMSDSREQETHYEHRSLDSLESLEEGKETPTMKFPFPSMEVIRAQQHPIESVDFTSMDGKEDSGKTAAGGQGLASQALEGAGIYGLARGALSRVGGIAAGAAGAMKEAAGKAIPAAKNAVEKAIPIAQRLAARAAPAAMEGAEVLGAAATTPAALMTGEAALATYGAFKANDIIGPKVAKGVQSLAASLGEKTQGINYYKKLLATGDLDVKTQAEYEQKALDYLEKVADDKLKLYQKAFENGEPFGDLSYKVNDVPQRSDAALADVDSANKQAQQYRMYLDAKDKKNPDLGATARFQLDGQNYSNPLYTGGDASSPANSMLLKPQASDNSVSSSNDVGPDTGAVNLNMQGKKDDGVVNPKDLDPKMQKLELVKRAIASAETGSVSDKSLDDPSRSVRTKGGKSSSAYGSVQITKSLAEGAIKNGLLDSDESLKKWTQDRFIPQGKKFLNSDYSDPKYGAGGKGDLNTPEDRAMYDKLADKLVGDTFSRNKGDILKTAGEWHYGGAEKDTLMSRDPKYAQRVLAQYHRDEQIQMAATSEAPGQMQLADASKEISNQQQQPIIVPMPMPSQQPQMSSQSGPSTKTIGASPNGTSESSMLIAIRQSTSPMA